MSGFTKGQPVTYKSLGVQPVAGTYVGPVKVSAKHPQGGHRIKLHGRDTTVVVKTAPTAHATVEDALAAVARHFGL